MLQNYYKEKILKLFVGESLFVEMMHQKKANAETLCKILFVSFVLCRDYLVVWANTIYMYIYIYILWVLLYYLYYLHLHCWEKENALIIHSSMEITMAFFKNLAPPLHLEQGTPAVLLYHLNSVSYSILLVRVFFVDSSS